MALGPAYGGVTDADDVGIDVVTTDAIVDGAVTTPKLATDAVTRSKLTDAAGMTFPRTAALFLPGIAGSRQRCSFSFDPTDTTAFACGGTRRGLSKPAASTEYAWFGLESADRPSVVYKNAAGVYTVELRENVTVLATYTWTDDLEDHAWGFATTASTSSITLDGVTVATGSAPSFLSTAFVFAIGHNATSATDFGGDHATWRDVYVTDASTATNKVYMRLDEPAGGPYRNAYLTLGDPLYDATNTSGVTIATTGTATQYPSAVTVQTVNGGDRPAPARKLLERTRVAAFGGLGAHATAGQFGAVTWAPTGTPTFDIEAVVGSSIVPSGTCTILGAAATGQFNAQLTTTNVLSIRRGSTTLFSLTGYLPFDGRLRHLRTRCYTSGSNIGADLYIDGYYVGTGTAASATWATSTYAFAVGGLGGGPRWPGTIYDVLIEDLNSAANSGYYLMDEARGSTTYANSYSGGTLAGLTINGFVSSCPVASSDGRGRSWQPGDGGAFRYGARLLADAAGITGVTSYTIAGLTEDERDPTGHYAAGVFTAPCAGVATFTVHAGIAATTLAGADDITLNVTATSGDVYSAKGTLHTVNVYVPFTAHGIAVLAAGDTLTAAFASLLAGDTYTIALGAAFHIDFTPTPAAG